MATYQLNVIFHGPFIFVKYGNHIEVLTPYIDGHDFGAGSWQMEQPCEADTYTLSGISPTCEWQPPDASTHVILDPNYLKNLKIPTDADYKFHLPLACKMTALGLIRPETTLFSANPDNIPIPLQVGSSHVLSYIMDENDKPKLVPSKSNSTFDWGARWKQVTFDSRAVNLHIFSESALDMGVSHPGDVFSAFKTMLGFGLVLVEPPLPNMRFELNLDVRSQGVDDEEQGGIRGLPSPVQLNPIGEKHGLLVPPRICDSPSMVIVNGG